MNTCKKCGIPVLESLKVYCASCGHPQSNHPFRHPFKPCVVAPENTDLDETRRLLAHLIDSLEPDAREALLCIAVRLKKGQDYYGNIDLSKDTRNFDKEREEELQDALVYSAFASIRRGRKT